jgi:metal-responsive CopG/Arc/MetJ family transcriptional regulator
MTSLSIALPDDIVKASTEIAKKIGISRTEFIRQAVIHEIHNIQANIEQQNIIASFNVMKKSQEYLNSSEELIDDFGCSLPQEQDEWWKNKF